LERLGIFTIGEHEKPRFGGFATAISPNIYDLLYCSELLSKTTYKCPVIGGFIDADEVGNHRESSGWGIGPQASHLTLSGFVGPELLLGALGSLDKPANL